MTDTYRKKWRNWILHLAIETDERFGSQRAFLDWLSGALQREYSKELLRSWLDCESLPEEKTRAFIVKVFQERSAAITEELLFPKSLYSKKVSKSGQSDAGN